MSIEKVIDVFSDASQNGERFAGAYVVGRNSRPVQIDLFCTTSMDAEFITAIKALNVALQRREPEQEIVMHIDIRPIERVLSWARRGPAAKLNSMIANHPGVRILDDARNYADHLLCHHHARCRAGLYGTNHPLYHELKMRPVRGGLEGSTNRIEITFAKRQQ